MIDSSAFEITIQPPRICPACHQRTLVELVFGMPGPELFEASEQGDLVLGGCCISPTLACDSPDLTCTTCNWTGFELYGQIFEENDLVGVMNAHAQRASELFLQGTGLGYFVGDNAGYEMPAGWAEMLSTMAGAFGEVVENAATVRQVADAAEDFPTEFGHSLDGHAELRFQAERSLESMRQRLVGLALAVIGAHADVGDATTVEMADRAAAGVLGRYRDDAAAAIETIYAETSAAVRVELAGKVCGLVMMHGSVMTLTSNKGEHVHFGWRSDPLGEWGLALWQDGQEPIRTWTDPLPAAEVVNEILQRLELDTATTLASVKVQSLESLFARW